MSLYFISITCNSFEFTQSVKQMEQCSALFRLFMLVVGSFILLNHFVASKIYSFTVIIYQTCTIFNYLISVSVCFFLVFLVNHSIDKRLRQILVLFCEVHFSILYILQLDLVSSALERSGSLTMEVLSQLGAHSFFPYPCLCRGTPVCH